MNAERLHNMAPKTPKLKMLDYRGSHVSLMKKWLFRLYRGLSYHLAGVQNSRSQGLHAVRRVGIEKLILHFGYEASHN